MALHILDGCQGGAFVYEIVRDPFIEGLVVDLGGRTGLRFRAHHDAIK